MGRVVRLALAILILLFCSAETIHADDNRINRIVFVVDKSHSMNYQDSEKYIYEMMNMFIDSFKSTDTEIGFVAYNDTIIKSYPLAQINSDSEREHIKNNLIEISRRGSTDIGLALKEGINLLNADTEYNNIMILFSDGATDLTLSNTGRSMEDSLNDENYAYSKASEINCKIYTIGISSDGTLDSNYLAKIADNTGGKKFDISSRNNILSAFNEIMLNITGTEFVSLESKNEIKIPIENDYIDEVNILVYGNNVDITTETENVSISKSNIYSNLKIVNPNTSSIDLKINGNESFDVEVIKYTSVIPIIEDVGVKESFKNFVDIKGYFVNGKDGSKITDKDFYKDLKAELIVISDDLDVVDKFEMTNTGDYFVYNYENNMPNNTKLQMVVSNTNFENLESNIKRSEVKNLNLGNNIPYKLEDKEIRVLKSKRTKTLNLSDYFIDIDGDSLSYTLLKGDGIPNLELSEDTMKMTPSALQVYDLEVEIDDGRGGVINESLQVSVLSFWQYYRNHLVTILVIFIILIMLYLLLLNRLSEFKVTSIIPEEKNLIVTRRKNGNIFPLFNTAMFYGVRFEGYFLSTKSGLEVPILNWSASLLNNRNSISLGELFSILDVAEKLPEAYKIIFTAGSNGTILFHHSTNCKVSFGIKHIQPNKKEVLNTGDNIYILFEDGASEIQIKFKQVGKAIRVSNY